MVFFRWARVLLDLSDIYLSGARVLNLLFSIVNSLEPRHICWCSLHEGFPGSSDSRESACNAGDPGSISGLGISPGKGNGNQLQYSCLENPTDRGVWWATVRGVAKSQTRQ